jgi:hypothetical protein
MQRQIDGDIALYRSALREGVKLGALMNRPGASAYDMQVMLAAKYGMHLHAVDMGARDELPVFKKAAEDYKSFIAAHPGGRPADFLASLSPRQLQDYSRLAGHAITPAGIHKIMMTPGGANALGQRRVLEGDGKTAEKIAQRTGNRPFIGLFGEGHSGTVNEAATQYAKVDLDGALRLKYGTEAIKTVAIAGAQSRAKAPDYVMDPDGSLRPRGNYGPKLGSLDRQNLCRKNGLTCGP